MKCICDEMEEIEGTELFKCTNCGQKAILKPNSDGKMSWVNLPENDGTLLPYFEPTINDKGDA